jgi:hypothetical protein
VSWFLRVQRVDKSPEGGTPHQLHTGPLGQVLRRFVRTDGVEIHHIRLATLKHQLLGARVGDDSDQHPIKMLIRPTSPIRGMPMHRDELILLGFDDFKWARPVDVVRKPGPPVISVRRVGFAVDVHF